MNRRHLIAIAGLAAISGPTLVGVQLYQWWDVPPDAPYHLLHTHEAKMVQHICGAMFPAGEEITVDGGDLYLERFFDQLLLTLGETDQKLIKLFLQFVDKMSYLSEYRAPFLKLSVLQQQRFLESQLQSSNYLVRNAFLSIITLLGMGYTSHPQISPRIAIYHRCGYG